MNDKLIWIHKQQILKDAEERLEEFILYNNMKITFWSFLISNQEELISILHISFLCLNKWPSTFCHKFVSTQT